ncbi:nuclear transport factor 2 family protein [Vibrio sp. FNV 38]|nr:nuclear transport factor 2 family protein [Vibrio sp. FNV 38]
MALTLEQRIQRLEDLEEIRTLQASYGQAVDKGWNGKEINSDKVPELFTEDAVWTNPKMSIYLQGHQQIMEFFSAMNANNPFFMHSFTNPRIEVDGDNAKAKWVLFSPMKSDGHLVCMLADYDMEYVRTTEGWRIQSLRLNVAEFLGQ